MWEELQVAVTRALQQDQSYCNLMYVSRVHVHGSYEVVRERVHPFPACDLHYLDSIVDLVCVAVLYRGV